MYRDEDIYRAVLTARKRLRGVYTIKNFLQAFHDVSPYPSTSTLYKRYGSIAGLIKRVEEWGKKQGE